MTDTIDILEAVRDRSKSWIEATYIIAPIADSEVAQVAARSTKLGSHIIKLRGRMSGCEGMSRMVAVLGAYKAGDAKVKVFTSFAGDESRVIKDFGGQ